MNEARITAGGPIQGPIQGPVPGTVQETGWGAER